MDLETVIQSEVSQKKKNKYRMVTRIYGISKKKMVLKYLGAGQEKQRRRREWIEDTGRVKGKLGGSERVAWTYICYEM